jgi:hypothetical protein
MIGIDPHKASHTAVAISGSEEPQGELRVRASGAQAEWAAAWPERAWAVEGAGGPGHLRRMPRISATVQRQRERADMRLAGLLTHRLLALTMVTIPHDSAVFLQNKM